MQISTEQKELGVSTFNLEQVLDRVKMAAKERDKETSKRWQANFDYTLARLQSELARQRQWLPIDPPRADTLTIEAALATDASGPRRFGCGTIRDYLIGSKVVVADGRVIKSGGKVVKNVAGYDLAKLFVGSHGSLGVIVEATFKLRPLPEAERFVQTPCESLDQVRLRIESVLDSDVTPVVLDLHNLPSTLDARRPTFSLVAGFAGTAEDVQ